MDDTLALSPRYSSPSLLDDQTAVIRAGWEYEVLRGAPLVTLLHLLAGGAQPRRTLVRALAELIPQEEVAELLGDLEGAGILVRGVERLTAHEAAVAVHLSRQPSEVVRALRKGRVVLDAEGPVAPVFREALAGLGLHVVTEHAGGGEAAGDWAVAVGTGWDDPRLTAFERGALRAGRPWLPVVLQGAHAYVGPWIRPGETAGFSCLRAWVRENDWVGGVVAAHGFPADPAPPAALRDMALITPLVAQAAAWEGLQAFVSGGASGDEGRLLAFQPGHWEPSVHPVRPYTARTRLALPPVEAPHPLPIALQPLRPIEGEDYRTTTPEDAYDRFRHLIDPVTGILRNERRLPSPPGTLLHTYIVEHAIAVGAETLDALRLNERAGSAGKGASDAKARAGALFEGIERYSSSWMGCEYRVRASYEELRSQGALDLGALLGFSAVQYATRGEWNAAHEAPALYVPEPLDPARPIDWVPVWSMTHDAWRYAPAAFTHLCYPEEGAPYCRGDSNGNAAGVTIEEAIIQGFLEVCERDSVALWWYGRIRRPGVDLASFPRHPYFTDLAAYYERVLSRRLHVLDLTSDLQIPTFVAVSHPADDGAGGVVLGFGAHFDAPSALYRALTELTQGLYSTGAMAADADGDPGADDRPEWLPVAAAREAYLFPDPERPLRTGADYGPAPKGDLRQAVNACVSRARAAGFEVCVANHTREHVGVPVVKVIVPGMLPWWRRLGLCRLYEAPVRMGWLVEGIGGGEVNPHSITM